MNTKLPYTNDIQFVCYLLANEFGIERSENDVWWAIYADAGRNQDIAERMLVELSNNKVALASFAQSLRANRTMLFHCQPSKLQKRQILAAGIYGLAVGVLATAALFWTAELRF